MAWPTRTEVANSATIVFITLVLLVSLIFLLNYAFSHAVIFLFTGMSDPDHRANGEDLGGDRRTPGRRGRADAPPTSPTRVERRRPSRRTPDVRRAARAGRREPVLAPPRSGQRRPRGRRGRRRGR